MSFIDEKIALMEREMRRMQAGDEKEGQEVLANGEGKLTLEELLEGVKEGKVVFPDGSTYTFETRDSLESHIPMVVPHNFHTDILEEEGTVILANRECSVSQTLTMPKEPMETDSIEMWKKQLEEGIRQAGSYAEVIKEAALKNLDYLTFRMPTAKGWTYNHVFRIHADGKRAVGDYSCMEQEKETFGQLLEALILYADELLSVPAGGLGEGA